MNKNTFRVLGIPGSLRAKSYNRALLEAAREVAPQGVEIEILDLASVPLYDGDVEAEGDPEAVRDLKERIRNADALLIATPEYNASIPGVLKNAIDWASRPPQSALRHKPIAIMGAAPGNFGTIRAQTALRQILAHTDSYVLHKPEVLVFKAGEKFDADGVLQDEDTREWVRTLVEALVDWTRVVAPAEEAQPVALTAQRAA